MSSPTAPDTSASHSSLDSRKSRKDTNDGDGSEGHAGSSNKAEDNTEESKEKRPNFIVRKAKSLWTTLDLDKPTLITMFRAACAPTIALAFYQSAAVANEFTTLGYLVAIASILAIPIMPRAKFLQNLLFNVLATCVGAALSLLAIWTGVQARNHTQPPGTPATAFNSSQAAVSGIWLFFEIYLINTLKSARPAVFTFPGILTSIFAVVSMTYSPSFPTIAAGESFARRLLIAFLTGFGIAAGVSLFVFPVSSRKVVMKEMTGYIMSIRGLLKAEMSYLHSLETVDMFRETSPAAGPLKAAVAGLKALHGKMSQDLVFAKRDFAWGHLTASDLGQISTLLRQIMLPFIGMSATIDILGRVAEQQGYKENDEVDDEMEHKAVEEYHLLMKSLHEPFEGVAGAMDEALEHILLKLKFKPKAKGKDDVEEKADVVKPGEDGFAKYFEEKVNAFYKSREVSLKEWCLQKGIGEPPKTFSGQVDWNKALELVSTVTRQRTQRELFVALYMEYLMWSAGQAILNLVRFADTTSTAKNRLILPGRRRMRKWVMSVFNPDTTPHDDSGALDQGAAQAGENQLYMGQAYSGMKDPEHKTAKNMWEKFGNIMRKFPAALRSPHSVFGFRVACGVMSIGIVAFLRNTHLFFLEQRLFWAAIMVAISMNRLSGQSVFNFIVRIFGTALATVMSYIIWYIVDGKAAGVLVFEFIWIFCAFWIVVKRPRFIVVGIISSVTSVLIIGYELQVDKIGEVVAESNFQVYYPTYLLAPYRLATVAGGLFVAFLWTIFPYPISENSELRKDLGTTLFSLAGHYAIVHETVRTRVRGEEGSPDDKKSPGQRLEKVRLEVFAKEMLLIQTMRANLGFQSWQLEIGGKFPKEIYSRLINEAESILSWMALIAYASKSFAISADDGSKDEWQLDFLKLLSGVETTSEQVSSRLALLSNSVSNGTPLPPYLQPVQAYNLDDKLQMINKEILSINHIAQPGYAAFAVMQIASRSLIYDLNKLTEDVKSLVGELDFSFRFEKNAGAGSANTSGEDLSNKQSKND